MDAEARSLENFKRCAEEAPAGTYEEAKALNDLIGATCDTYMREVRTLGLQASACDAAFQLSGTAALREGQHHRFHRRGSRGNVRCAAAVRVAPLGACPRPPQRGRTTTS